MEANIMNRIADSVTAETKEIFQVMKRNEIKKQRNQSIGKQFGELIKGVKSMNKISYSFFKGKLEKVKVFGSGQDGHYMPFVEHGIVKMIYIGYVYREYTVSEFITEYGGR